MKKVMNLLIKISFVIYILALCVILFFGSRGHWTNLSILEYAAMQMNLVPFKTIFLYVRAMMRGTMNLDIAIANLLGNFLLFLPMGIYLPWFFVKIRYVGQYLLRLIPMLFIVELIQLLTKRGSFDIDDLILNLAGAVLGYCLWKSKAVQCILEKLHFSNEKVID